MNADISSKNVILFIWKMVKPFPSALLIMCLVAFFWATELSVRPYILKIILNRLTTTPPEQAFAVLSFPATAYVLISLAGSTLFRFYGYFVEISMIPNLRKKIALICFGTLLDQSHHYYQNQFSGSLTNKVNDLINSIPDLIQLIIDRFFSHSLALVIAIFTLWQVNMKFALFMLAWAFLFTIGSLFLSKRLTHLADTWSECGSTFTGKVVDALSNILSIRLFARKRSEQYTLEATVNDTVHAEQHLQWSYFWVWFTYSYLFVALQAVNLYFLIKGHQEGWITVGDFALVLALNIAIVDFLWQLTREFSNFSRAFGKATQALRTLIVTPEIQDLPHAKELHVPTGKIVFENVQFNYPSTEPLFENKSVTILPGEKVGLVGYSGSGKSTFAHLILRLYEVNAGAILIDDQNIQTVTQDSLRHSIGMIPQDPSLFHRSLMENIRYGKIDASDDDVIEAAKKAHAHSFIAALPQGYQSLVGERGVKLSGGQRQRIAIARAILKNAPILILDEATSQLDSVTENDIQDSLWTLMQNKTTLIIAHRLSTLLQMDRILVFDQGKIVEDGSHQTLLQKGGMYRILWDAQIGGFLPDKKMV